MKGILLAAEVAPPERRCRGRTNWQRLRLSNRLSPIKGLEQDTARRYARRIQHRVATNGR